MTATLVETPKVTRDEVLKIVPKDRVSPFFAVGTDVTNVGPAKACLQAAGALWDVEKVPLRNALTGEDIPGFFQVTRTDNKQVVGVVEGQYKCVQNAQFFGDIADQFIADGARIKRVSWLHRTYEEKDANGQITKAVQAEVGGQLHMVLSWDIEKTAMKVVGDIVGRTAIIRNSHDGKTAATISYRLLQLACYNGAVVPVPGFSFDYRISHTDSAQERIREAAKVLAKAPEYFQYAGKALTLLAKEKVTPAVAQTLTRRLIDSSNVDSPSQMSKGDIVKVDAILDRFNGNMPRGNSEAMRGTAYGWYSAVLDFSDYGQRVKKSAGFGGNQQRFKSAFSGVGHQLKLNAWDLLASEFDLSERLKKIIQSN